jgi:hypothetical protein
MTTKKPKQNYKGNGNHEWVAVVGKSGEAYDGNRVERLRVPGGWIYRDGLTLTTVFVPMPTVVKYKV